METQFKVGDKVRSQVHAKSWYGEGTVTEVYKSRVTQQISVVVSFKTNSSKRFLVRYTADGKEYPTDSKPAITHIEN
jgi:hypothetical protein